MLANWLGPGIVVRKQMLMNWVGQVVVARKQMLVNWSSHGNAIVSRCQKANVSELVEARNRHCFSLLESKCQHEDEWIWQMKKNAA